jgi:plasmid stabilization system protein ParE
MGERRPLKIQWADTSVFQLEQINRYVEPEGSDKVNLYRRRILNTVTTLGDLPFAGRTGRIKDTREAVVPRTPYIVIYQVSEHAVEILGIWHGAREWPESLDKWNY